MAESIALGLPDWIDTAAHLHDAAAPRVLAVCESEGPNRFDLLAAVNLAVADARTRVRTLFFDDRRNAEVAVSVAHSVAQARATAVIGHFASVAALPASRVYRDQNVLFLAPGASHPALCDMTHGTTLQFFGSDDGQIACLDSVATPASNALVLAQRGNYGERIGQALFERLAATAAGARIVYLRPDEPASPGRLAADHNLIYLCGSQEFSMRFAAALRFRPGTTCVFSDDAYTAALQTPPPGAHVYAAFLDMVGDTVIDQSQAALSSRASALLGRPPGPYFLTSYIALRALCRAWQAHSPNDTNHTNAVLQTLKQAEWQTPFGLLSLKPNGELHGCTWRLVKAGGDVAERRDVLHDNGATTFNFAVPRPFDLDGTDYLLQRELPA
ncbi:ABC transporter substrate-binding protein [Verminephrobacter aporrectodeae]|uniref:ABC transporter substrate-binding protein n=1 Tax=Verminephrobacter aporrectodeae TaxID=1110389 RepID=UPI0022442E04|nr:ABC transporter substrate-binding protein [Verminephrobacter aporrectodeae]MCW8176471.1 amino acid ABC transporter substrate-binding protein [Verminephrobacter aporrectodeae subsp. tuberculatae]MCW8204158.1 amino acid ABC transporter substrate-binding protein [Verminephrobacter aporrectodeae subsp. tuberculatae]